MNRALKTMPLRRAALLSCALLLALAALLAGCKAGPAPPEPPAAFDLMPTSPLWDTPATRQSKALGGLALEWPFPGEGPAWVFTGKAPAALVSRSLTLEPGRPYRLSLWLRRGKFVNDHYLWLNFLGQEHRLDSHCAVGGWQKISLRGVAPATGRTVVSLRSHVASRLLLSKATLEPLAALEPPAKARSLAYGGPFPVGAYLDRRERLAAAAACGLNTVVTGAPPDKTPSLLGRAHALGLRVILYMPLDAKAMESRIAVLRKVPPAQRPRAFYLQDEPEIRSTPAAQLLAARRRLLAALPWASVVTAMVRPERVEHYAPVYDAVFMDQYPVSTQPLNWLADSIGTARGLVRPGGEVWAVVQAFGGGKFTKMGWPRPPNPAELNALTASALTAGAQGVLFYHWRYGSVDNALGPAMCRLAGRLKRLGPWLPLRPGLPPGMGLSHLGRVKTDPSGGPAVRTGWSRTRQGLLVMLVNTTPHTAEVALHGAPSSARQLWRGGRLPAVDHQLRALLAPRQARAWLLAPSP